MSGAVTISAVTPAQAPQLDTRSLRQLNSQISRCRNSCQKGHFQAGALADQLVTGAAGHHHESRCVGRLCMALRMAFKTGSAWLLAWLALAGKKYTVRDTRGDGGRSCVISKVNEQASALECIWRLAYPHWLLQQTKAPRCWSQGNKPLRNRPRLSAASRATMASHPPAGP